MRIGELATKSNCSVETIRYYESAGLLPVPGRSDGNYRIYGKTHLERLRFIRQCRLLDMAHDEIRELLRCCDETIADCTSVNSLLERHIGHVTERIRHLKLLERKLKALRAACVSPRSVRDCGIVLGIASAADEISSRTGDRHIAGAHAVRSRTTV